MQALLKQVATRFQANQGFSNAAALTYTTLLALVPLMTVSLSLLSTFPVFNSVQGKIQHFIFSNMIASSGKIVEQYLVKFSSHVNHLPAAGLVFLLFTALLLIMNVEKTLNRIWGVKRTRPIIQAFLLYWAILTLAPILLGASITISTYLFSLPYINGVTSTLNVHFMRFLPWFCISIAFTIVFVGMPNCRVPVKSGVLAGVSAGLLFELAKKIFALYIKHFPTYEVLYGALAAIPIFLIWMYCCWVITLIGAELSVALSRDQS
ncbi:MAG: hypothetical protein DHS20C10_01070 [marine bacterium B5-7]|nr:MAG: hypothetical protein DHS20C10_01070 [marine bacterium B5-7]